MVSHVKRIKLCGLIAMAFAILFITCWNYGHVSQRHAIRLMEQRDGAHSTRLKSVFFGSVTGQKNNRMQDPKITGRPLKGGNDGGQSEARLGQSTDIPSFANTNRLNQEYRSLFHNQKTGLNHQGVATRSTVRATPKSQMTKRRLSNKRKSKRKKCWQSDPKSWTVTQLRPSCKVLKSFVKANSVVKRIVFFNKTVKYTGCNATTVACKEQPYYSWRLRTMIERPPCCISHILETFRQVMKVLDDLNIQCFLVAGGLIGWVKNKSIPRHENDLDVLVDPAGWRKFKAVMKKRAQKLGHAVNLSKRSPQFVRIYYSKTNRVHVDAWPYRTFEMNGTKWVKAVSDLTWFPHPYESIFPLRRTTYSGIPIWIPNDPEDVLDRHYRGSFKWRKPITCKSKKRRKCID